MVPRRIRGGGWRITSDLLDAAPGTAADPAEPVAIVTPACRRSIDSDRGRSGDRRRRRESGVECEQLDVGVLFLVSLPFLPVRGGSGSSFSGLCGNGGLILVRRHRCDGGIVGASGGLTRGAGNVTSPIIAIGSDLDVGRIAIRGGRRISHGG